MSVPKPTGRPPVAEEKRRRTNTPASYGLAEPVDAGSAGVQPDLGFEPHEMVASMWKALSNSVEGQFLSTADWQRARIEMWFLNQVLSGQVDLTASNWQRVQNGMNELLISPADKRRAGIQLKKATSDADEDAAENQIANYRNKLAS
jgi:hypothetical protein